jgi:hypothetical protein
MWTLILFTMLANSSAGGGVQTNIAYLDFNSEGSCTAAVAKLAEKGTFMEQPSVSYRIEGKCVQRTYVRGR